MVDVQIHKIKMELFQEKTGPFIGGREEEGEEGGWERGGKKRRGWKVSM